MTDARSNMAVDPIWDSRNPLVVAAPSPKGAEMVFHDPLPAPMSKGQASRAPVVLFDDSPEPKPLKNERPATRADRLETVSRELKVLAHRRGKSTG
jgi:hypothetical protein